MAENSSIEWTHHTFNPWWGCAKVSPGCDNCYAENLANRFSTGIWGPNADRRTFGDKHWNEPLKWNRKAAKEGTRYRVFTASMADVFDKNAPEGARDRLWKLIKDTPSLDWLLLTKRIGNAANMLPDDWGAGYKNVWLGISVVNQEEAYRDIPKLLDTPARLRWLSIEPLLAPLSFGGMWIEFTDSSIHKNMLEAINWVVAGGESGKGARPMHPEWARTIRDQCQAAGVPFLFKQWGEWAPESEITVDGSPLSMTWQNNSALHICEGGERVYRVGKKLAGRTLDGKLHDEYPIVDEE